MLTCTTFLIVGDTAVVVVAVAAAAVVAIVVVVVAVAVAAVVIDDCVVILVSWQDDSYLKLKPSLVKHDYTQDGLKFEVCHTFHFDNISSQSNLLRNNALIGCCEWFSN